MTEDMTVSKAEQKRRDSLLKKLSRKYNRKRQVNEFLLGKKTMTWQKVISITVDIICALMVIFSSIFCFNLLNSRTQGTPPSVFGYSALKIVSGSMQPEFSVGSSVMVQSADAHTLKKGDIIAFYVYGNNKNKYDATDAIPVDDSKNSVKHTLSVQQFFGIQSKQISAAASSGAMLVFHQIVAIERDSSGRYWFSTKGTNNASVDMWHIDEDLVLGVYVPSGFATWLAGVLGSTSSTIWLLLLLMIPIILLALSIIFETLKELQIIKLQKDCVEMKRKITDPICVKNKVGILMDKKSKYKVLAQADDEEKIEYANLLWGEGKVPNCVKEYFFRRNVLLAPLQKLKGINLECEQMVQSNVPMEQIVDYYLNERTKIDNELKKRYQYLKKVKDNRQYYSDETE